MTVNDLPTKRCAVCGRLDLACWDEIYYGWQGRCCHRWTVEADRIVGYWRKGHKDA